jgi:uncharacterized protein YjbI with pentapeptide repeats
MRQITKPKLDQILKQHQLWLESDGHEGARARLEDADLQGSDLRGADLQAANLRRADLRRADLRDVDLRGADLQGSDLREADLREADLEGAGPWDADLRGAQFSTNIRHCHGFAGAKFTADALPWLILHPSWVDWKDSVRIEEMHCFVQIRNT